MLEDAPDLQSTTDDTIVGQRCSFSFEGKYLDKKILDTKVNCFYDRNIEASSFHYPES